jgi:hypothetical protein
VSCVFLRFQLDLLDRTTDAVVAEIGVGTPRVIQLGAATAIFAAYHDVAHILLPPVVRIAHAIEKVQVMVTNMIS